MTAKHFYFFVERSRERYKEEKKWVLFLSPPYTFITHQGQLIPPRTPRTRYNQGQETAHTLAMPAAQHDTAVATPTPQNHIQSTEQLPPATITQLSVFTKLPSELILDIFSYLDIVTTFRFLDTCRYHRYLLLNLPEIWQRVRFIPLSEYSASNVALASLTTLSAAAGAGSGAGAETTAAVAGPSRYRRPVRTKKPSWQRDDSESSSGSESESGSDGSDDTKAATTAMATTASTTAVAGSTAAAHRLKHAENERDRERGGSRTLISEIYAVLRRFRKENRLVDFVREVHI